ncbi:MAG: ATP-binding protein [Nitratireductor sp.]
MATQQDIALDSLEQAGELSGLNKFAQNGVATNALANEVQIERNTASRFLGFLTVIALLVSGSITFLILFGLTPIEPNETIVRTSLIINTLLAFMLVILIGVEVRKLIKARQNGRAAARLHIRIVGLFALVAAIPAILVAIIAGVSLDLGLDRWFEQRTRAIVDSSVSVARAYVDESARVHVNATISMANDLDSARRVYSLDRSSFERGMAGQTRGRGMLAASLIREDGSIIMQTDLSKGELALPQTPEGSLETAAKGELVFIPRGKSNLVGALLKMKEIPDAYLYTIRTLRNDVLQSLVLMEQNTDEYDELSQNRLTFQLTFAVLYLGISLMILLSAIYMGISVADRFVRPIRRLITAADEVSSGNLDVEVQTTHTEGDFKNLSDTFNVMISDLNEQRTELVEAKDNIDRRARFTQAVLSGVSASVIGVDKTGKVQIANRTAQNIFGKAATQGNRFHKIHEELGTVFEAAKASGRAEYREQVSFNLNGQSRSLNVQVTQETDSASDDSFVITIDDITDLVAAQRSTAWSDVARRIAHEIKNPLTPIQLSAERIKKRYSKYVTEDREVFDQCTDTIIRQVGDIGRMVDEFSSFARMPKPEMVYGNVTTTLQEAMFTQRVANPATEFKLDVGNKDHTIIFDARLLSQAFINIIKNAVEAIEGAKEAGADRKGVIAINIYSNDEDVTIDVIDNGKGLPVENRQQLLEPYMTTRAKGTGLGLAIVRKILEDHGGTIELMDAPEVSKGGNGAMMRLKLPKAKNTDSPKGELKKTSHKEKSVGAND